MITHAVRATGGPQADHSIAEVQIVVLLVDEVGLGQAHACEVPGHRFAQPGEHFEIAVAFRPQVGRLVAVDQIGRRIAEGVRAERALRMEMCCRQIQPTSGGDLLGERQLHRSPAGVALTTAGAALYDEACALLAQADRARARVLVVAGTATLTIGTLAEGAEQGGTRLATAFRHRHPGVEIRVREADFADPTAGLRAGLVDIALTRTPFDQTGITVRVLRTDPVGAVLRADNPLAQRDALRVGELADRLWFRLPDGTDPLWQAYWTQRTEQDDGPMVRTMHECLQAVLWNGTIGIAPLVHELPDGLTAVPLTDMPPSNLVLAWNTNDHSPLIRSFTRIAADLYSGVIPFGRRRARILPMDRRPRGRRPPR
ncbi:LysR family transcriptional regulator [Nocardia sp. NPDC052566]|uniref:LysR family transcriptional regulator n=1 Tax=Nocardia sp. NPDC052566 TaxID=3364330 RepID=UPI0037C85AA8